MVVDPKDFNKESAVSIEKKDILIIPRNVRNSGLGKSTYESGKTLERWARRCRCC